MLVEAAHAKLNLSLAIIGRRPDGFHGLVSLVAPLDLADTLSLEPGRPLGLTCDDATLPADAPAGHFHLAKRVPHGAGLGGGSSDAAAALRLLDRLSGEPLGSAALEEIAADVGSDCPFFVRGEAAIMRGRGECLEPLPPTARAALAGRRVVVVKPPFGVPTPEAYGLFARSGVCRSVASVEAALGAWLAAPAGDPSALGNDLAAPVFAKHVALPAGLAAFGRLSGSSWRMTGSGSACFAFVDEGFDLAGLRTEMRRTWGPGSWSELTRISA